MKNANELINEVIGSSSSIHEVMAKSTLVAMSKAYKDLEGMDPKDIGRLGVEPKEFASIIKKLGPLMDKLTAIQRVGK